MRHAWLPALVGWWIIVGSVSGAERTASVIAPGTRWATPCYVQASGRPGPVVMITGGVHGDEPAGAEAAEQIRHWTIRRGTLLVVPRVNPPALDAKTRLIPKVDKDLANLNRNFPKTGPNASPRGEGAPALWECIKQHRPDWFVDLHEGSGFHQENSKTVGSSVIIGPGPDAAAAGSLLLDAVNADIADAAKKFARLGPPIAGSLARAAGEHLKCRAMILETTIARQPLSRRVRQHRLMVHRLLTHLDMLAPDQSVDMPVDRAAYSGKALVALYDAGGADGKGIAGMHDFIPRCGSAHVMRIGAEEIRSGALHAFDVVVFPGGSGSREAAALGENGRKQVETFVQKGGGYLGICAGAYLGCAAFPWGLKICDAKTVSPLWERGDGTVQMELTDEGRRILADRPGRLEVRYVNGPIVTSAGLDGMPKFTPLAFFRTELAKNGTPAGVMVNAPAMVAAVCGKGRVILCSPHPEQTPGLEPLIVGAVHWLADRKPSR